jgi:putative acetyltransferase
VRIELADPGSPEARSLIAELDEYSERLYPPESNHLVPAEELRRPNVAFLLAWLGAETVGCGALVDHAGQYGELKRVYVRPPWRRGGVARAILGELFGQARSRGLRILRLETGNAQPEALALYERAGFRHRGPFGHYREDPLSLFMELELD